MENNDLLNIFKMRGIVVKIPTMWFFKNSMKDNFYNAHLMVRYKAIQAYYGETDNSWWNYYNLMQAKRYEYKPMIGKDKLYNEENFKKLIQSFENNGFLDRYPIIVNKYMRLVDGSHRLSLALYFNIDYVPIVITEKSLNLDPEYSLDWLVNNGFENKKDEILDTYKYICNGGSFKWKK